MMKLDNELLLERLRVPISLFESRLSNSVTNGHLKTNYIVRDFDVQYTIHVHICESTKIYWNGYLTVGTNLPTPSTTTAELRRKLQPRSDTRSDVYDLFPRVGLKKYGT